MTAFSRLAKAVYVLALALAVILLLEPARSPAQFRGTPGNFAIFTLDSLGRPVQVPNNGRIIGLPPPPMMLPLNNMMFGLQYMDSTGSPIAIITSMPGGGMGGGAMGMMGMGGGMMGMSGGGMMGMGGGMTGMGGMGMGGMSMMGMGGMSGGGMGGFAGKGMGGFNGRKAL